METIAEGSCRDGYGFTVAPAYQPLHSKFVSVWAEEEEERSERWEKWLQDLRRFLRTEEPQSTQLDDIQLMERALQEYTTGTTIFSQTSEAAALLVQLWSLVQMGVPMNRRGLFWKVFLNVKGKMKPGMYETYLTKALEADPNTTTQPTTSVSTNNSDSSSGGGITSTVDKTPLPQVSKTSLHHSLLVEHTINNNNNNSKHHTPYITNTNNHNGDNATTVFLPSQHSAPPDFGKWGERDWLGQIDKDLHRTFPGHPMLDMKGRGILRRILAAYSARNPIVGYCQGLNFLAAAFMLLCPEEDAFWCLTAVVEDILPGYFDSRMVAPQVDALALTDIIHSSVPNIAAHLQSLEVDAASIASSWFLVAFLNSLPFESCLRVWDVLFFERSPVVLFRVALGLIDIYSQPLLETVDSSDAYMLLQAMGPMSFDASRLIDVACIGFGHIKDGTLQVLRDTHRPQVIDRMRSFSMTSDDDFYYTDLNAQPHAPPSSRSQSFADGIGCSFDNTPSNSSPASEACSIEEQSPVDSPRAFGGMPSSKTTTLTIKSPLGPPTLSSLPHSPLILSRSNTNGQGTVVRKRTKSVRMSPTPQILGESPRGVDNNDSATTSRPNSGIIGIIENQPKAPPPSPSLEGAMLPVTKQHRQRRTRSEMVFGANGRSSLSRPYWEIDLHRLASFVPDFRQPAVAAAYRIAATPPARRLTATTPSPPVNKPLKVEATEANGGVGTEGEVGVQTEPSVRTESVFDFDISTVGSVGVNKNNMTSQPASSFPFGTPIACRSEPPLSTYNPSTESGEYKTPISISFASSSAAFGSSISNSSKSSLNFPNTTTSPSKEPAHSKGTIRTLDFSELYSNQSHGDKNNSTGMSNSTTTTSKEEGGSSSRRRHVPRRFTDGGALLLLSKTIKPDLSPHLNETTSNAVGRNSWYDAKTTSTTASANKPTQTATSSSCVSDGRQILTAVDGIVADNSNSSSFCSVTGGRDEYTSESVRAIDGLSPGTRVEKATRLRNLHTRLQIEVEAARTRKAEAEEAAQHATTMQQDLTQQLAKIKTENLEKAATLVAIKAKVTELTQNGTTATATIKERKMKIEQLQTQFERLTIQVKHQATLQKVLMDEMQHLADASHRK